MAPTTIAEYMRLHPEANIRDVRQANGINPDDDMNDYRILADIKPPTDYYIKNGYPMLDVVNISDDSKKRTQNQKESPSVKPTSQEVKNTKIRNDIAKRFKKAKSAGDYFEATINAISDFISTPSILWK